MRLKLKECLNGSISDGIAVNDLISI
jgi:hypothetical protein